jgi:hypothetical protein
MFDTAKEPPISLNAFPFGQMHAALRATHHVVNNRFVLPGLIFSIRPDDQVNNYHDGDQK